MLNSNNVEHIKQCNYYVGTIRDVNPCPCPYGLLKDIFEVLVLVLVLGGQVLVLGVRSWSLSLGSGPGPCPGPCGSGPCPYSGPCGLVLVLVFSPCKDLFSLFHYSDLFAYYCSVNAYN